VHGSIEAERIGGDRRRLREKGNALDHIGQLPDVPRPAMRPERGNGISGEALRGEPIVSTGSAEKLLDQKDQVVTALAQRRNTERHHGQPVVEVLAESPSPDGGLEVLARGGDDPDVDGPAHRAAQGAHLLLLHHLEQLGLKVLGQEADLVQEDGAAISCHEQAGLGLPRVGEGSALEAEHLGFHERFGNGRAVDVHERPAGAGPLPVQGAGDEALARAGLTKQENGRHAARGTVAVNQLL
jgi:hypothetical protein